MRLRSRGPSNPAPDAPAIAGSGSPSASAPRSGTPPRCGCRRRSSATARPAAGSVPHGDLFVGSPLQRREQPQRRIQRQQVGGSTPPPSVSAQLHPCSKTSRFPRIHPLDPGLQAGPVQFAAAKRPPVREQAFHDLQAHPPDRFSGPSAIDQLLEVALEVGPADLSPFQRQLAVNRPAIAADDAADGLAQQGLEAPELRRKGGSRTGRHSPSPPSTAKRLWPAWLQPVSSVFFAAACRTSCWTS